MADYARISNKNKLHITQTNKSTTLAQWIANLSLSLQSSAYKSLTDQVDKYAEQFYQDMVKGMGQSKVETWYIKQKVVAYVDDKGRHHYTYTRTPIPNVHTKLNIEKKRINKAYVYGWKIEATGNGGYKLRPGRNGVKKRIPLPLIKNSYNKYARKGKGFADKAQRKLKGLNDAIMAEFEELTGQIE